ncbi:MAG TPA: hypothetical protein VM716_05020 [Gemmatimonadales bacterium]|nr:hypothetical protein [Gemmatimonadales bacterium]
MRASAAVALAGVAAAGATIPVQAQDWTTAGYDAQRSSWVRTDPKISPTTLRQPGFQLLWTVKVDAEAPPVLLDLLIGHRGFKALGFFGASADRVLAVDTDLGRIEWQRRLTTSPSPAAGSPSCASAWVPNVARATNPALPAPGYGGGRGGEAARSAVGEPRQGAVTLAAAAARRREPRPPPPPADTTRAKPLRQRPSPHPFPVFYVLASDGALHTLNVMDGSDAEPPVPFVPPNAEVRGLIVVDDVAYVATGECGKAPAGMWALDLGTKHVTTWRGAVAGAVGPAMGPDGTIYVATARGELIALEPLTLARKGVYRTDGVAFISSPVIFEHHGRKLIAAATRDGRVRLVDASGLAAVGAPTGPSAGLAAGAGALVSWVDSGGTRWLLGQGRGGVVSWKVVDQNEATVLQPGWTSRDIPALSPLVINGVVFAVSGGRSRVSVLHALDGATGLELWNSGTAIGAIARGALSGESGQVYVVTNDGTVYGFGFPMEH